MIKAGAKIAFFLILVIALSRCIDPYTPTLSGYESFFVVEGLVTNENTSYTVKLSQTLQEQYSVPTQISDASVYITDNEGLTIDLKNMGSGIYRTDSTQFQGSVGKTYVLHILTNEGAEYESEPCTMQSVPEIDSIYYGKVQEITNNGTLNNVGIRIFLDSKPSDSNTYYRWSFDETWKFRVPSPKKYIYINDSTIIPADEVREYCWKNVRSNSVLVNSISSGQSGSIVGEPIFFIDPLKSDRLSVEYSMLISQYSISKKEFDFWNSMKKLNDSGSDIFSSQPFPVISNIHNVNNTDEKVLGYFSVSAVKQKRKFIAFSDILKLNLPFYRYPCARIEMAPKDYPRSSLSPPLTWDSLYEMYCIQSDYYFVEPKYYQGTNKLEKLVFTRPECADCELTGTTKKPDFWIDLN